MILSAWASMNAQTGYLGERATYQLTYLSVSAVTINISVPGKASTAQGSRYHILASARTNALFSVFYNVDNRYDIYMDSATTLPVRMDKNILQKTLEQKMTITYRHRAGEAVFHGGKFTEPLRSPIAADAHNFFTMIYWLRHQTLKTGDQYTLNLDVETEPWKAVIRVTGEEKLKAAGKNWEASKIDFAFLPQREEIRRKKTDILTRRLVTSKTRLTFWIAKQDPHPFLKVEFEVSPFNVVTILTDLQY